MLRAQALLIPGLGDPTHATLISFPAQKSHRLLHLDHTSTPIRLLSAEAGPWLAPRLSGSFWWGLVPDPPGWWDEFGPFSQAPTPLLSPARAAPGEGEGREARGVGQGTLHVIWPSLPCSRARLGSCSHVNPSLVTRGAGSWPSGQGCHQET